MESDKPTKSLYRPKTRLEDYIEYSKTERGLYDHHSRGHLSDEDLQSEIGHLINVRLEGMLFTEDARLFDTPDELKQYLAEQSFSGKFIDSSISHEQEHADKALELGYTFYYGCWLLQYDPKSSIKPIEVNPANVVAAIFIQINEQMTDEHSRTIRTTPVTRSHTDY